MAIALNDAAALPGGLIRRLSLALRRARAYRATLRELKTLSARELRDLGLNACDLKRVALEQAEMAARR